MVQPPPASWGWEAVRINVATGHHLTGTTQFCTDYHGLNSHTNAYPLSHISDTVKALHRVKQFFSLDLMVSFWQTPIQERDKTTLCTTPGLMYKCEMWTFDYWNEQATFSKFVELIIIAVIIRDLLRIFGHNCMVTDNSNYYVYSLMCCNWLFPDETIKYPWHMLSGEPVFAEPQHSHL